MLMSEKVTPIMPLSGEGAAVAAFGSAAASLRDVVVEHPIAINETIAPSVYFKERFISTRLLFFQIFFQFADFCFGHQRIDRTHPKYEASAKVNNGIAGAHIR